MLLSILGLIDIIAGTYLIFSLEYLAIYIGIFILLKSLSSLIGGFWSKGVIIMGAIDLLAGLGLIYNWSIPWIGFIILVKGLYSFVSGFIN